MARRGQPSSRRPDFHDSTLYDGFEAVQRHEHAATNARDRDSVVGDAIVYGAHTDSEGLRGLGFGKGQRANACGIVRLPGQGGLHLQQLLEFLADDTLDCLQEGLCKFVEREGASLAAGFEDESYLRHARYDIPPKPLPPSRCERMADSPLVFLGAPEKQRSTARVRRSFRLHAQGKALTRVPGGKCLGSERDPNEEIECFGP